MAPLSRRTFLKTGALFLPAFAARGQIVLSGPIMRTIVTGTPPATLTDAFTNTNGVDLTAHAAGGNTWLLPTGANTLEIQSNRAVGVTVNDFNVNYVAGAASAHYAQALVVGTVAVVGAGPAIRIQSGANSFFYCLLDNGTLYPGQCVAGSGTDWTSVSVASGSTIKIAVNASTSTTIHVYDDAVEVSGSPFTGKNALSGGSYGVGTYNVSIANSYIDDWVAGNS